MESDPVQPTYMRTNHGRLWPAKRSRAAATCSRSSAGPVATPSGVPAAPSGNTPKRNGDIPAITTQSALPDARRFLTASGEISVTADTLPTATIFWIA
jgi:hypothetical protein